MDTVEGEQTQKRGEHKKKTTKEIGDTPAAAAATTATATSYNNSPVSLRLMQGLSCSW